jgi:type III secretion protein T
MDFIDYLDGLVFCTIRPGVALALVPFGNNPALGFTLRVPLVLMFAVLPLHAGWPPNLLSAIATEVLVGVVLGLLLGVVFHVASAAGALLDLQGGYTIAAVYDPNLQQESSLFETLFTQFAALTFFTGAGLRLVCGFFADAWAVWPPGVQQAGFGKLFDELVEQRLAVPFADGVRLAMPLIGLMLLVDMSLGLMSRHVKKLNPFSTARTVKAMILSFGAMASVPVVLGRLNELFMAGLRLP